MTIIKPIPQPKPAATFAEYAWIIYSAWLLFGIGHYIFVNEDLTSIKIITPLVLLFQNLYTLYTIKKAKDPELVIDDAGITWLFEDLEKAATVKWNEIGVVRIEDDYIILYIGSSLARPIDLRLFEKQDQDYLVDYISTFVAERKLSFANVSNRRLA